MKNFFLICIIYIVAVQVPLAQQQTTQAKSITTTQAKSTTPATTTINTQAFAQYMINSMQSVQSVLGTQSQIDLQILNLVQILVNMVNTTSACSTTTPKTTTTAICNTVYTLNDTRCIYQNKSLVYMHNNYAKKYSLTNYGGISWTYLTGFEQTVTNGISTYYAVEYSQLSPIVIFNEFWVYLYYQNLPFSYTYTTKYVGGYFYFSSNDYFYKTYSNFALLSSYKNAGAAYRQFFYDSVSSKFYVAPFNFPRIDVFDTSCTLLQSISLGNRLPFGLVALNEIVYATVLNSNQVLVIKDGLISKYFTVTQCAITQYAIFSITVDSFGYLAFACFGSNLNVVYDLNGNYMNGSIPTSAYPSISAIDTRGRFVLMTKSSLDIYY